MSIEIIVIGLVFALVVGNLIGAKPKPHETRLGDLRLMARKFDLHPKFANPTWPNSPPNPNTQTKEPTKGLIQYTLINDDWRLAMVQFTAKNGVWHTDTPHSLAGQTIDLPNHLTLHIKGMMTKANTISLYWHDDDYIKSFGIQAYDINTKTEQDLITLKNYLTKIATLT